MHHRLILLVASLAVAVSSYARVNIPPWMRTAIPAEVPAEKDADAIVLLDDTSVTVLPDGSLNTRYRRVVKILNNDGRGYGVANAWIDHDTKLRTLRAWSIDASGAEYEVRERDAIETTPTDFELYTDARLKVLSIPAANPGSIVGYEVEFSDVPYLPQTQWQFQEDAPVLVARFDLQLPAGWTYEAHWMNRWLRRGRRGRCARCRRSSTSRAARRRQRSQAASVSSSCGRAQRRWRGATSPSGTAI
jgi:hypothetical protein